MKVGDSVMCLGFGAGDGGVDTGWDRIGLVLELHRDMVLVFWGEDYPCEEEYPEQLQVVIRG
ncbi:MAG TPA: hypothetical protein EYQ00_08490 [Dehalococcoidia bacterium]|nr:hypothetical protein [Dehalococcoidia bacterium]